VTAESKGRKRPRDPNQLAKFIVDVASGQIEDRDPYASGAGERPRCVKRGRSGGVRGDVQKPGIEERVQMLPSGVMRPRGSAGSRASLRSPK
jgi:hypothetical protein